MYLHLFSGGSLRLLDTIAAQIGELVTGVPAPIIGYLPGASEDYGPNLERITTAFAPVGTLRVLDVETTPGAGEFAAEVAACHALFMPGGNTYLLSKRMHRHQAMRALRIAVRGGVPLFTVSAGTVFCG